MSIYVSLQNHPQIKHNSHKNKGNDQQLKKLMIITQFLLMKCLENSIENMHTGFRV